MSSPAPATLAIPPEDDRHRLGIRRKPQLRLALGYRDESRRGAPVKTDYFIPKGNDRAVAKFKERYGDTPRAIDVRLPSSLASFLEIKHLAFAGGQNGEGGVLKAVGRTNFALEGTLGGPDLLTVFNVVDGNLSVEEVEIDGVDDPAAVALGLTLTTTVTFGIPDVLGFGGIAQISSRGKESTDTLWLTAVDIYGQLGAVASMILRPKILLKPSKMLTPGGQRTDVFVLDLFVPESLDEILAKAREYRELMPAQAAFGRSVLYGSGPVAALGEAPPLPGDLPTSTHDLTPEDGEWTDATGPGEGGEPAPQQADAAVVADVQEAPAASAPEPEGAPWPTEEPDTGADPEPSAFQPPAGATGDAADAVKLAADSAALHIIPNGKNKDKTIEQVAGEVKGDGWIRWAIKTPDHGSSAAARAYARHYLPTVYQQALAELETQGTQS